MVELPRPGQFQLKALTSYTAETVILNEVKNLNSFPQANFRTHNRDLGKDFRPFGKLRAT